MAGERFLLDLFDEDAALDGVSHKVLAETAQLRLRGGGDHGAVGLDPPRPVP